MKSLLIFCLRVALFIAVAVWLADQPGVAHIVWRGYVIDTSASFLLLLALGCGCVLFYVLHFLQVLRHGPTLWHQGRRLQQLELGHERVTQALVAIAGGRSAEAGRLAISARKKLGVTTAILLLQAQAAQLAHDHRAARVLFRTLTEEPDSAILGYRGLIMEARRCGNWAEVENYLIEAATLDHVPWLDGVHFEIAARKNQWVRAGDALQRLAAARLVQADTLRHYRAALLLAQSQMEAGQGSHAAALASAERACQLDPESLPALINLAQRQATGNFGRVLRRTVEKGWKIAPHPQLAAALRATEPDIMAHYKQIEKLCRAQPELSAHLLAQAEAALAADLWGEARRCLLQLVNRGDATSAAYRLLAQLERREHANDKAASLWLAKAAEASPDPAWVCASCGGAQGEWQPTCRACSSFAALEWRQPGSGASAAPSIPLLSDWS